MVGIGSVRNIIRVFQHSTLNHDTQAVPNMYRINPFYVFGSFVLAIVIICDLIKLHNENLTDNLIDESFESFDNIMYGLFANNTCRINDIDGVNIYNHKVMTKSIPFHLIIQITQLIFSFSLIFQ